METVQKAIQSVNLYYAVAYHDMTEVEQEEKCRIADESLPVMPIMIF